jgi:hypothetical protein
MSKPIVASFEWSDRLAQKLISRASQNGNIFHSLPDDGTRFSYIRDLYDDAEVFYGISKEGDGYHFICIKGPCRSCSEKLLRLKYNAMPVAGRGDAEWWRASLEAAQ